MPIKIKTNFDIAKTIRDIQQNYIAKAPTIIETAIVNSMERGESPVENGEWKTPYSKSYIKAMSTSLAGFGKRPTPVNLKLSGQLHSDVKVVPKGNSLIVGFNKTSEWLAVIHNENGRRVLPNKEGEEFNNSIQNKMDLLLRQVVKNFIK